MLHTSLLWSSWFKTCADNKCINNDLKIYRRNSSNHMTTCRIPVLKCHFSTKTHFKLKWTRIQPWIYFWKTLESTNVIVLVVHEKTTPFVFTPYVHSHGNTGTTTPQKNGSENQDYSLIFHCSSVQLCTIFDGRGSAPVGLFCISKALPLTNANWKHPKFEGQCICTCAI